MNLVLLIILRNWIASKSYSSVSVFSSYL